MNSYQLFSRLNRVRKTIFLTTTEQCLFYELIAICNEKRWSKLFEVKNKALCLALNISERTLVKSRRKLLEAGLIHYFSTKCKRTGCRYSFVDDPDGSPAAVAVDKTGTPATSPAKFAGDGEFTPYKENKTINKEKEAPPDPLIFPFSGKRFLATWNSLLITPKWRKKEHSALQISLNKLGRFNEEFAVYLMERSIESNWSGVVFPETQALYQQWLNLKNSKQPEAAHPACERLNEKKYELF